MTQSGQEYAPNPIALDGIEVLSELSREQRTALAGDMILREYAPKQIIINRNESSRDVYFLINGKVKATFYSSDGREVTFQLLENGQMFGELAAIDGQLRSSHVQAINAVTLAVLPEQRFWRMLDDSPEVRAATLRRLTGLVRFLCEKIVEFSTLSVKDRVCASLVRMAREVSEQPMDVVISDPPTHADIACIIGTHREAVTKVLKQLERRELIEWRPGLHLIRDVDALISEMDRPDEYL